MVERDLLLLVKIGWLLLLWEGIVLLHQWSRCRVVWLMFVLVSSVGNSSFGSLSATIADDKECNKGNDHQNTNHTTYDGTDGGLGSA